LSEILTDLKKEKTKYDILNEPYTDEKTVREDIKNKINPKGKANINAQNSVNRIAAIAIFTVAQLTWLVMIIMYLSHISSYIQIGLSILSLIVVLTIYGRHTNAANKMPWMIFIMFMPVFGITLYLLMGRPGVTKKSKNKFKDIDKKIFPNLCQDEKVIENLQKEDYMISNRMNYIRKCGKFPIYSNTDVWYFDDAKKGIEDQIKEMENAKEFIFMEYFAFQDEKTFASIKKVLAKKVKEGIEVRIIYDDVGSGGFINTDFIKRMEKIGVKCCVFNHVTPFFQVIMNNRDHRKITVIDGKVGYTGGYNIADLYTHVVEPHGFWKDTGVKLKGDAVFTLTALFLEMWNSINPDEIDCNVDRFLIKQYYKAKEQDSFVLPYAESPLKEELIAENAYIGILQTARKYCYFVTPYLVITDELCREFEMAAKRGVDVRIITPGIPDKKAIYAITRSYYNELSRNGVRIYEYTPGFCHAKMCVSDDNTAIVGTINLDFRSLYLHFENAVMLYKCRAIEDISKDFEKMFEVSKEVTNDYNDKRSVPLRISQCALRVIAPLV